RNNPGFRIMLGVHRCKRARIEFGGGVFRPTPCNDRCLAWSSRLTPRSARGWSARGRTSIREKGLTLIDESAFAKYYCPDNGRPNASVQMLVSVLLLKEIFNLTDRESISSSHRSTPALLLERRPDRVPQLGCAILHDGDIEVGALARVVAHVGRDALESIE